MKVIIPKYHKNKLINGLFIQKKRVTIIIISVLFLFGATVLGTRQWSRLIYFLSYFVIGYPVIKEAFQNILKGDFFDENFLMTVATIGALTLQEYPEAVAVMLFYEIGELFEDAAVSQSKHSISSLLKVKSEIVTVKQNGKILTKPPQDIIPGQIIILKPGERVPLDGQITAGQSTIDTSALTGETLPITVSSGDHILSGSINQSGLIEMKVQKSYQNSTVARILELVENANQKKTVTEKFVKRFAKIYTPAVIFIGLLLATVVPLFFHGIWFTWLNRALIFLVISCPCALVISVPLSFFCGIGIASRQGILIKGSNFLEVLNRLDTVAFDKTGTLTLGEFKINQILPIGDMGKTELLGLAAAAEQYSTHPIAQVLVKAFTGDLKQYQVSDLHELSGYGIQATINQQHVYVGSLALLIKNGITDINVKTKTSSATDVYIAISHQYAGSISVSDQPKSDAHKAIELLKNQGIVSTVLLTGDTQSAAEFVGHQIGIEQIKAQLLPAQKVSAMDQLIQLSHQNHATAAFVGDGINDTPVLARADVGIAMGGLGSDAAIETADIVIMNDQPSKVSTAIAIAKKTNYVVWENIILALTIKMIVLLLGALGITGMWEAVFADVGVTILAILNALRIQRFNI